MKKKYYVLENYADDFVTLPAVSEWNHEARHVFGCHTFARTASIAAWDCLKRDRIYEWFNMLRHVYRVADGSALKDAPPQYQRDAIIFMALAGRETGIRPYKLGGVVDLLDCSGFDTSDLQNNLDKMLGIKSPIPNRYLAELLNELMNFPTHSMMVYSIAKYVWLHYKKDPLQFGDALATVFMAANVYFDHHRETRDILSSDRGIKELFN